MLPSHPPAICSEPLSLPVWDGPIAPWSVSPVPPENWLACSVSPTAARRPSLEDHQLVRAIAGHASIALENACLFTRMQQANRHWLEIFDAISDFIVVHDEQHNVLRVNRSLADFVGIARRSVDRRQHARARSPFHRRFAALLSLLPQRRRSRRICAPRPRAHLPDFHLAHSCRQQRPVADRARAQGHHRPPRSRAPLSRTVRQHSGRNFLLHAAGPLRRSQRRAGSHPRL